MGCPIPSVGHSLQVIAVLANKPHDTRGDLRSIASLRRVLCNTLELQENITESRQRLVGADSVLSAMGHRPQNNRQGLVPRSEAPHRGEDGNLRQAISASTTHNPAHLLLGLQQCIIAWVISLTFAITSDPSRWSALARTMSPQCHAYLL